MTQRREQVISYFEMCRREGISLQAGMNYRVRKRDYSILLMNASKKAPYQDRIEDKSAVIIYEGHNAKNSPGGPHVDRIDQPLLTDRGAPTQNAYFYLAAWEYKKGLREAERVKIYEKLARGLWIDRGFYRLVDAWVEQRDGRRVFKFKLLAD